MLLSTLARWLVSAVAALVLILGAYWTLLFLAQRRMMFPAPLVAGSLVRPADARQIWLDLSSARTEVWFLPATGQRTGARPLLIFTHGNAELIDNWARAFDEPRSWGIAVLLVEYPGYGRSSGSPSQETVTEAVLAAYDWAIKEPGIDSSRIIAYGRSLGGGASCVLAANRSIAGLVLESTFSSVRDLARSMGVPRFLVRDPFDNRAVLATFSGPTLLIHGERDEIIPPSHARRLHAAAPSARLQLLPCGHNDCPPSWDLVRRFLSDHGLL